MYLFIIIIICFFASQKIYFVFVDYEFKKKSFKYTFLLLLIDYFIPYTIYKGSSFFLSLRIRHPIFNGSSYFIFLIFFSNEQQGLTNNSVLK